MSGSLLRRLGLVVVAGLGVAAAGQLIGVSVAAIPWKAGSFRFPSSAACSASNPWGEAEGAPKAAVPPSGESAAGERVLHDPRPLAFEANRGQADDQVKFLARGRGYTAFFTSADAVLTLGDGRPGRAVVRLKPVGSEPAPRLVGDGELPGLVHYDRGDRSTPPVAAPTYRGVRYVDVYPGIDLAYYGGPRRLEYDFVVAPGADPARIALAFDGVEGMEIDAAGDLVAHTAAGDLRQPRPVVYQTLDGDRRRVDGDYVVDGEGHVRVRVGAYDTSRPLVIDPVVAYSTYLGGSYDEADDAFEGIEGIAVDGSGNVYVTGTTTSPDFPTTTGAADRTLDGVRDIFVTKLSPTGAVLYSTYLGGPCDDSARDIAVDAAGNAYVTGRANAGQCYLDVQSGVLVAKLDPTGAVLYASVFGGRLADSSIGEAIAVDAQGHAYVTGSANSDTHDFPTTPGAFRTAECANVYGFANDVFVAKLSADGSTFLYSTILCGTGDDSPAGIAIDAAGAAYVAGTTASSDFPTVNPLQAARGGGPVGVTGFVSKLSPDGSRLIYSTYLGGSTNDGIGGIAVDGSGNAYVTGGTESDDFPTTPGVLQEHAGNRLCIENCTDAFVSKIDPSGSTLVYSTYLFGEVDDAGSRIAVDGAGNAYVVGTTNSRYFPILDAFQALNHGLDDAFITKLAPDGTRLVYSSYLGGSPMGPSPGTGADDGSSLAIDATGNAYVVGYTQSYDFPTTPGAFQPNIGPGVCDVFGTPCGDAFVAKITAGGPGVVPPINLTVTPAAVASGGTVTATWAGIAAPTAEDHIRLYTLGSPDGYPGEILSWWPTTGAAAGTLLLALPDGLPAVWYEMRLYTADPDYPALTTFIARSEPIRIAPSTTSTTTTLPTTTTSSTAHPTTSSTSSTTLHTTTTTTLHATTTTTSSTAHPTSTTSTSTTTPAPSTTTPPATTSCETAGAAGCDDGDPCTVDLCVPGHGCTSSPASGFDGATCTCRRTSPAACAGELLPPSIDGRREQACSLLAGAAASTDHTLARRRLRKAMRNFRNAIAAVTRAHKNGVSDGCVGALDADLRDAKDRVERVLAALGVH